MRLYLMSIGVYFITASVAHAFTGDYTKQLSEGCKLKFTYTNSIEARSDDLETMSWTLMAKGSKSGVLERVLLGEPNTPISISKEHTDDLSEFVQKTLGSSYKTFHLTSSYVICNEQGINIVKENKKLALIQLISSIDSTNPDHIVDYKMHKICDAENYTFIGLPDDNKNALRQIATDYTRNGSGDSDTLNTGSCVLDKIGEHERADVLIVSKVASDEYRDSVLHFLEERKLTSEYAIELLADFVHSKDQRVEDRLRVMRVMGKTKSEYVVNVFKELLNDKDSDTANEADAWLIENKIK